jgi:hypothetical protein
MEGDRRKTRYEQPALWDEAEGEARSKPRQGTEPTTAQRAPESPAKPEYLMEVVVGRENMEKPHRLSPELRRVRFPFCHVDPFLERHIVESPVL